MAKEGKTPDWKKPLILAGSLFVLGSFVYWLEFSFKPGREDRAEAVKKLFNLKKESVAWIRIIDGKKVFTFHCLDLDQKLCKAGDSSKWEILEPVKAKADDANLGSLLSSLGTAASTDSIDLTDEDESKRKKLLVEYALDEAYRKGPKSRRVELGLAGGEVRIAYLGDLHPVGESHFMGLGTAKTKKDADIESMSDVKFDENRVLMVPTYFKSNLDHDLTYWRDKRLMVLATHELVSFDIDSPKGKLTAERKDAQWLIREGKLELAGDNENIDAFLNSVGYLTAKTFTFEKKTEARAKALLASSKKSLNVTFKSKEGEPLVFSLYEKGKDKLFATLSNTEAVYEIEATAKERLFKSSKDLRLTKLLTSVERFTIKKLNFDGSPFAGAALELEQNKDGHWVRAGASAATPIDADKLTSLLDKLAGNRIKEFIDSKDAKAYGPATSTENSALKITFGDETEPKKRQLAFWKKGNDLFARDLMSTRKEVYKLDPSLKDALPWEKVFFDPKAEAPKK